MTTSITGAPTEVAEASTLDRRRGKAQATKDAADAAQAKVADIEARLTANTTRAQQDQTALQKAQDEVVRLKRALKVEAKESTALRSRRKKASAAAAKAKLAAQGAEAKYDKAVLADMVRREKERDRAAAASTPKQPEPAQEPESAAREPESAAQEPESAAQEPQTAQQPATPAAERPSDTQTAATRTAARRTAAAAARPGPVETLAKKTPDAS